ncbi:MAG: hypothetical protein K6E55_02595 [Thermoguttaceae bacterium]|nr:hypothetical protein [Thermoguttaceae bacterium]
MLFEETGSDAGNGFPQKAWTDEQDPQEHFSAVSLSAVFALVAGVFSLLYLVSRAFWPIPAAAVCIAILAFWRIGRSGGRLTGTALARAALVLALIPFSAVPIQESIYRRELVRQAREFFPLVIEAAQKGDSLALCQFKRYQTSREHIDDETAFWKQQLSDPLGSMEAVNLLGNKVLLAICNLGDNAKITYQKTAGISYDKKADADIICMIYAVTYSEHDEKKTFLIPFYGARTRDKKNGVALWRCTKYATRPLSLKGTHE